MLRDASPIDSMHAARILDLIRHSDADSPQRYKQRFHLLFVPRTIGAAVRKIAGNILNASPELCLSSYSSGLAIRFALRHSAQDMQKYQTNSAQALSTGVV